MEVELFYEQLCSAPASAVEVVAVVEPAAAVAEIVNAMRTVAAVEIANVVEEAAVAAVSVGAAVHVAEVYHDLEKVVWAAVIALITAAEMTAAVAVAEMWRVAHKVVVAGMPVVHMTVAAFEHFADSNPAQSKLFSDLAHVIPNRRNKLCMHIYTR